MNILSTNILRRALSTAKALFLGSVIVMACSAQASAQVQGKALKVHMATGSPHYYLLADSPVITFNGTECQISSPEFSKTYDMSEISYAEIVENPASVNEQLRGSLCVDLSNPSQAVISGMEPGSRVTLVNLSGITLRTTHADAEGTAILRYGDLPAAIYIISSKETTFKYIKK